MATILIQYCGQELLDHRKDLIRFAWNQLKSEEITTKHWAYANICHFISAYDTPPKIILQVGSNNIVALTLFRCMLPYCEHVKMNTKI